MGIRWNSKEIQKEVEYYKYISINIIMKETISIREYYNLIDKKDDLFYELKHLIKNNNNTQDFDKKYPTITAVENAIYDLLNNMKQSEREKLMESITKDIKNESKLSERDIHLAMIQISKLKHKKSIFEDMISKTIEDFGTLSND